jgi:hypothetical protein
MDELGLFTAALGLSAPWGIVNLLGLSGVMSMV